MRPHGYRLPDSVYLFTGAFAVRIIYCFVAPWTAGDSVDYLDIARNLRSNGLFALTVDDAPHLTAFRPPAYPALVAMLPDISSVLLLQSLLGAITVVLVYLIGRAAFNRKTGLIAAGLLVLAPLTIHYTAVVMTETLFTFLIVLAIYLWGRNLLFFAGIVLGLAALTRPIIFPFLALIIAAVCILPEMRKQYKSYALMIVMACLVPSFWIVRNSLLTGEFTLTQSSGFGTNLLYGTLDTPTGDDFWTNALKQYPINEKSNKEHARLAIERITSNPGGWTLVRVKQYPRLYIDSGDYLLREANQPIGQALSSGNLLVIFVKAGMVVLCILFYGLAACGVFLAWRELGTLSYLWLFPLFLSLIHLVMWVEPRYYLPAVPLCCIFAAGALQKALGFSVFQKLPFAGFRRDRDA